MRPALILTAALMVFGACSGGETSPPGATPTATVAYLDRPPAAIARAGAASVAMGLGSFCWASASTGLCADAIGIITGGAALRVGRDEAVTIGREFAQTDFEVELASIRPVEDEPVYEGEDWVAWSPGRDWPGEWSALEFTKGDEGLRLTAELSAGRYLVNLSLSFPQGSASYGLVLDVQ